MFELSIMEKRGFTFNDWLSLSQVERNEIGAYYLVENQKRAVESVVNEWEAAKRKNKK